MKVRIKYRSDEAIFEFDEGNCYKQRVRIKNLDGLNREIVKSVELMFKIYFCGDFDEEEKQDLNRL